MKIEFSIAENDIELVEACPCCGITLSYKSSKLKSDSSSVDRIDNKFGYVSGNIQVICFKCNFIKGDRTSGQLRMVADYIDKVALANKMD